MSQLKIVRDDLSSGHIVGLLNQHHREMLKHSPPDNVHALTGDSLRSPSLSFGALGLARALPPVPR